MSIEKPHPNFAADRLRSEKARADEVGALPTSQEAVDASWNLLQQTSGAIGSALFATQDARDNIQPSEGHSVPKLWASSSEREAMLAFDESLLRGKETVVVNLDRERRDLAMADRHLVEGEERVTKQRLLAGQLRAHGHEKMAADAERILATLVSTLDEWRGHRKLIAAEIERRDGQEP
jgi:hypothetical protein